MVSGEFVVACGDAPEVFEPTVAPLDDIAAPPLPTPPAGRGPCLQERDEFRMRERHRCAASAKVPAPANQRVVIHVLDKIIQASIAVLGPIFEDRAEFA